MNKYTKRKKEQLHTCERQKPKQKKQFWARMTMLRIMWCHRIMRTNKQTLC